MFDFPLQDFYVLLLRLDSVLVHLALELHAWKHLFGIDLEVLQLLNDSGVFLLLRKTHKFVIQTDVLQTSQKLGNFLLRRALHNQTVDQLDSQMAHLDVPLFIERVNKLNEG